MGNCQEKIDDNISLYGAVYYARAVLREELQKNGSEMPNPLKNRTVQKVYKKNNIQ